MKIFQKASGSVVFELGLEGYIENFSSSGGILIRWFGKAQEQSTVQYEEEQVLHWVWVLMAWSSIFLPWHDIWTRLFALIGGCSLKL